MKRIGMGQLRKEVTAQKIQKWGPCEIMSDGVVVGMLLPAGHATAISERIRQGESVKPELRFGKEKQAAGQMRR